MKTIMKVEIEPILCMYIPRDKQQGKVYISEYYNTSSHLCLCGCGQLSVTPLNYDDKTSGWDIKIVDTPDLKTKWLISLTPSILNNNCPNKSHYIITKNIANFV